MWCLQRSVLGPPTPMRVSSGKHEGNGSHLWWAGQTSGDSRQGIRRQQEATSHCQAVTQEFVELGGGCCGGWGHARAAPNSLPHPISHWHCLRRGDFSVTSEQGHVGGEWPRRQHRPLRRSHAFLRHAGPTEETGILAPFLHLFLNLGPPQLLPVTRRPRRRPGHLQSSAFSDVIHMPGNHRFMAYSSQSCATFPAGSLRAFPSPPSDAPLHYGPPPSSFPWAAPHLRSVRASASCSCFQRYSPAASVLL